MNTFYRYLDEYACKGYRTLCFAVSVIDSKFYEQWAKRYKDASVAIHERELKLAKVAEEIECNLRLLGVSAIEDKLQDVCFLKFD